MASGTLAHRPGQKEIAAFIRESGRSKIIAERNELAAFRKLEAGLLAQFAQPDRGDFIGVRFRFVIDLASGNFPDRGADRDTLLSNENQFSVEGHRRNNDGALAPD